MLLAQSHHCFGWNAAVFMLQLAFTFTFLDFYRSGVSYAVCQGGETLATGEIDFRNHYTFVVGDVKQVDLKLVDSVASPSLVINLKANVTFENMHRFVQVRWLRWFASLCAHVLLLCLLHSLPRFHVAFVRWWTACTVRLACVAVST